MSQQPSEKFKRVNVLIRPDQYDRVMRENVSLSGLVRDLLDDRFSQTSITLSVTPTQRKLYDLVISNFGSSDGELGEYLVKALDQFLADRGTLIEQIRASIREK